MKIDRLLAAVVLLATAAVFSASAQQQKPTGTAAAAPQTAMGPVPDSKMAVIYSDMFLDPKGGISRFSALLNTLNREFQPRQTELNGLQQRIATLQKEISDTQNVAAPDATRQKSDQLAQLQVEYKRKGEDAESAYGRRRQEIFGPLQVDIGKALEAFAKSRGITVIVDGSQVPMVYADNSIDITKAFISDFNSKNPATASVPNP